MREIEFRAWLKKQKKMVRVKTICIENKGTIISYDTIKREGVFLFDEIELMQYTGLKDKNGVKIFEGDIVRTYILNIDKYMEDRSYEYYEFVGVITWNEEYLEYYIRKNSNEYEDVLKPFERYYEIIGNIYENPKLMEGI